MFDVMRATDMISEQLIDRQSITSLLGKTDMAESGSTTVKSEFLTGAKACKKKITIGEIREKIWVPRYVLQVHSFDKSGSNNLYRAWVQCQ